MTDSHRPAAPAPLGGERVTELRELLPRGSVSIAPEDLEAHGHDETEDFSFLPQVVARPASPEEVSALLAWATRRAIPVTPQGARTGLSGGALPVRGGVSLSLERLDRIRRLDRRDQIVEVEAGVVTATLQRRVAAVGLYYPPDPASREECQIGGNLAEDSAGPHSCGYGTTRRYVLGLEVVLADGTLLTTGGANRKDASGYNLTQLLVGSEGTLGVITAAILRLVPQPTARLTVGFAFDGLARATEAVLAVFDAGVQPAACELMEGRALELVARSLPLPGGLEPGHAFVLVDLHGADVDELMKQATVLDRSLNAAATLVASDERDRRNLWRVRERIGVAVKQHSNYKEVDAVVPRSCLLELVNAARSTARAEGLECVCYGHAGDGNLHINLLRGNLPLDDWNGRRAAAENALVDATLALGGAITGEHGIGWTQRAHLERAYPPAYLALLRRLKRAFDPAGILNPGKVLPG